jgi:hypothetical protein
MDDDKIEALNKLLALIVDNQAVYRKEITELASLACLQADNLSRLTKTTADLHKQVKRLEKEKKEWVSDLAKPALLN